MDGSRRGAILDGILEAKRREVARLRAGAAALAEAAAAAPPVRDFAAALRNQERLAVVAEFKRRSPSAGALSETADAGAVAAAYRRGGAAALSVLTDGPGFGGSLEDLAAAREAAALPVLRKDFLVDPLQLLEARGAGADAVLLIVRLLSGDQLGELLDATRREGMAALVEVHDAGELERATAAGAEVVGVNARDLETFEVDLPRALELVARVPPGLVAVAESGVEGREDAERAALAGADAVLVGSRLMRGDPERGVAELTGLTRRPRGAAARVGRS